MKKLSNIFEKIAKNSTKKKKKKPITLFPLDFGKSSLELLSNNLRDLVLST